MKITKTSNVLAVGDSNSKQTTIPYMLCELLRIEAGDQLEWSIDGAEEEPTIELRLLKKDYE